MGSESTLRKKLVKMLRTVNAMAVENNVGPGTPDVCVVTLGIWIEVKRTLKFPKREDTIVTLDHELLETQKVWLRRCARRGGKAYTLTQIASEFFIHHGPVAADVLGKVGRPQLAVTSDMHCVGWDELERRLLPFLVHNA